MFNIGKFDLFGFFEMYCIELFFYFLVLINMNSIVIESYKVGCKILLVLGEGFKCLGLVVEGFVCVGDEV